jgi:hypothetical protein
LRRVLDGVPTGDNADGREQAGEDDEPEAEAVDANVVEDGGAFDPGMLIRIGSRAGRHEVRGQMKREDKGDERW